MDYLIEIGTEELPAGTTGQIADNFKKLFLEKIKESNLEIKDPELFSTPRRIALLFKDLPAKTAASVEVVKGPGKQAPAQALESFLTKNKITQKDLFEENGRYCYKKNLAPKLIEEVLKESLEFASNNLSGEKWMTWANGEFNFSRPVRWLVSLLDNKVFPVELFGLQAASKTRVNRLLESESEGIKFVEIKSAKDYEETLRSNLIEPEREVRKKLIVDQVVKLENQHGIQTDILNKQSLLEEIVDLLEWPIALVGEFDKKFLELPEFLTTTVLEHHQRYFPCYEVSPSQRHPELVSGSKKLSNKFIFIANCLEKAQTNVIQGNQRVLAARLKDAEFFVQEDLKLPLGERLEKLKDITFLKELGKEKSSYYNKVERLMYSAENLFNWKHKEAKEDLRRVAILSKCDLASSIVFEFPELQGQAGGFIAKMQNEKETIYKGISEHYLPTSSENSRQPTSTEGHNLSITDKADNITAAFLAGKIPSGSADPFALRRQTQGIVELLINPLTQVASAYEPYLNIEKIFCNAFKSFHNGSEVGFKDFFYKEKDKKPSLSEFIRQRIIYILSAKIGKELSEAFFHDSECLKKNLRDYIFLAERFEEEKQINPKQLTESLSAIRRILRIIKSESLEEIDELSFIRFPQYEKEVFDSINEFPKESGTANWSDLNELTQPINNFFDNVLVNDPKDSKGTSRRKNLLYTLLKKVNEKYLFPDWDKLVVYLENKTK